MVVATSRPLRTSRARTSPAQATSMETPDHAAAAPVAIRTPRAAAPKCSRSAPISSEKASWKVQAFGARESSRYSLARRTTLRSPLARGTKRSLALHAKTPPGHPPPTIVSRVRASDMTRTSSDSRRTHDCVERSQSRALGHPPAHAGGTTSARLAGEGHPQLVAAGAATGPHEAELEVPAAREALQLPRHERRQGPRPLLAALQELREVPTHQHRRAAPWDDEQVLVTMFLIPVR